MTMSLGEIAELVSDGMVGMYKGIFLEVMTDTPEFMDLWVWADSAWPAHLLWSMLAEM